MGGGIAQLACCGGYETFLHDPVPEALEAGRERLREGLESGVRRGRMSEAEAQAAAGRLNLAPDARTISVAATS